MSEATRRLQSTSSLVSLVAYLMPFFILSCPGQRVSFTGVQVTFGVSGEMRELMRSNTQRGSGHPLALGAFACAVVALGCAMAKGASPRRVAQVAAAGGAVLLAILASKIGGELRRQAAGLIQLEYGAGFWLAMAGHLGTIVFAARNAKTVSAPNEASAARVADNLPRSMR